MSVFRKNTLVVDFSVLPKRPDAGIVQQFLEKRLKLQLAETTNIQLHNIRNVVYIETVDNETALRYEKANHYKHTITCNNKKFKIPVYVDSEAVTVRVHDLPTHTQDQTIIDFMGQHGVVISIARERWKHYFPGIYNGVRVLRMKLSRPIPSCVTIDGETTLVTYRNQPKTCRICGNAAHPKQKCTSTTATKTPASATPSSSGLQLTGKELPSLPPPPVPNDETKVQQNKNINNNENKTGDIGDDHGNDDDDDDDDDEDGNDFIEVCKKRRMSIRRLQKQNEMKKNV